MSNFMDYAKTELAKLDHDEDGIQDLMDECILDLLNIFSKQRHSGFVAYYCLSAFNRLANFKPLTPLTGEDDEWEEVEPELYQNKRYSSVFKRGKDGKAYNINGKVFSDDNGETWYYSKYSRIYIDFPYTVPESPEEVIRRR